MMKRKLLLSLSWAMVVVICCLIFKFSGYSAEVSSAQSSTLIDWFLKHFSVQFTDFIIRKFAHFFEYLLLGFFTALAVVYSFLNPKKIYIAVIIAFLYAVSDELHQLFVPGRACQFRDMMIDLCGIFLGAAFFWLLLKISNRLGGKKKDV